MAHPRERTYYGLFFFLSVAAFIVPVIVAVQSFTTAPRPFEKPTPAPDASGVDHQIWDYLLKMYVKHGLVGYDGIRRDYLFTQYIAQLEKARPEALPSDSHRLALLCNAYNAFVINGVVTHGITNSVMQYRRDGVGFFDLQEHRLAGQTISLNHLEHKVIRQSFSEPRIHMALVCAAISCPPLRPAAFVGGPHLERQLEDQLRLFVNDPDHVRYDKETHTLHLSAILQWYGEDFDAHGGYRTYLAKRASDPELRAALEGDAAVQFNTYLWDLNAQARSGSSAPGTAESFGSGSIPNR